MSDKLISAEALYEATLKSRADNPHSFSRDRAMHNHEHSHFLVMIDNAPAVDAVEVVRCSQCLHRDEDSKICKHPKAIGWDAIEPEDDDFCSYGEWRDDNGDDVV